VFSLGDARVFGQPSLAVAGVSQLFGHKKKAPEVVLLDEASDNLGQHPQ
jgi:hypothetical protein